MLSKPITSKYKSYEIHDNGGRPFIVDIIDNTIHIRCTHYDLNTDTESVDDFPRAVYECEEIFIGKSPKCPMTLFSGGHGCDFDGNTILVRVESAATNIYTYIWIGGEIIKFTTEHKIILFESLVGNNDMPYPWAMDDQGSIYLIIESVVMLRTEKLAERISKYGDPYSYYYKTAKIIDPNKKEKSKMFRFLRHKKPFGGVTEFYLGNDEYILRYIVDPIKDYDRVVQDIGPMSVLCRGQITPWSKSEYVNFIDRFGEAHGLKKMCMVGIICERFATEFKDI